MTKHASSRCCSRTRAALKTSSLILPSSLVAQASSATKPVALTKSKLYLITRKKPDKPSTDVLHVQARTREDLSIVWASHHGSMEAQSAREPMMQKYGLSQVQAAVLVRLSLRLRSGQVIGSSPRGVSARISSRAWGRTTTNC